MESYQLYSSYAENYFLFQPKNQSRRNKKRLMRYKKIFPLLQEMIRNWIQPPKRKELKQKTSSRKQMQNPNTMFRNPRTGIHQWNPILIWIPMTAEYHKKRLVKRKFRKTVKVRRIKITARNLLSNLSCLKYHLLPWIILTRLNFTTILQITPFH